MTTLQKIAVTAALTVTIGGGLFAAKQAHDAQNQVRTLQAQQTPLAEQVQQLQAERDKATNRIAWLNEELAKNEKNNSELLKLRGEVGLLRIQISELGKLRQENQRLHDGFASIQNQLTNSLPTGAEYRQRQTEIQYALQEIVQSIENVYVAGNNEESLTNLNQLVASANLATNFPGGIVLNDFKIINPGVPARKIMVREIVPRRTPEGKFEVEYGSYGKNSVFPTTSSYDNFDDWDQRHIITNPKDR